MVARRAPQHRQYAQHELVEAISSMAKEQSNQEEWETEEWRGAREAQDDWREDAASAGPEPSGQSGRFVLPDLNAVGDQPADWAEQPTQPQRRIQARGNWPAQPSGVHPVWPLLDGAAGETVSPVRRLLDAAGERQFNLGCGTLAALVLIVAALLAAVTNGWLPINAGPLDPQPASQANPAPPAPPTPTITPHPSPTATPAPTDTPFPTAIPTDTPVPTASPIPTQTPEPTPTATPVPTATPSPTAEPTATPAPAG